MAVEAYPHPDHRETQETINLELRERVRDQFPTPEDWVALQGGKPRVFRNPQNPNARWIVLHVYDEHPDQIHRFINGAVIDTLPVQPGFDIGSFQIAREDEEGKRIERVVRAPRFMVSHLHGDPCSDASGGGDRGSYRRIASQAQYVSEIADYKAKGLQEVRFAIADGGERYTLRPLPRIREPQALEQ